jgi:hypothetical protein
MLLLELQGKVVQLLGGPFAEVIRLRRRLWDGRDLLNHLLHVRLVVSDDLTSPLDG